MELYYDEMDTPIGKLTIVSTSEAVVRIDYGSFHELETTFHKWANRHFHNPVFISSPGCADGVKEQLHAYFQGKLHMFTFDFAFYGTDFQRRVWKALYDTIPFGKTKTYKDIAVEIGNEKAIRAVGGAVNKNPFSIIVPCHRVIGSNNKLVGYNGGLDKKAHLLEHEAACVKK